MCEAIDIPAALRANRGRQGLTLRALPAVGPPVALGVLAGHSGLAAQAAVCAPPLPARGVSGHTCTADRASHGVPCCAWPIWVLQPSSYLLPWGFFSRLLPPQKTPERGTGRVGGRKENGRGEGTTTPKAQMCRRVKKTVVGGGGARGCLCSRPVAVHTQGAQPRLQPCCEGGRGARELPVSRGRVDPRAATCNHALLWARSQPSPEAVLPRHKECR